MAELLDDVRELLEKAEDESDDFFGNLLNPASDQLAGALRENREDFNRWENVKQQWALVGLNDRGQRYTVREWLDHGAEIADAIATVSGLYWAGSSYNAVTVPLGESAVEVADVVQEVKEQVEKAAVAVANPWPLSVKVLLWTGAGVAGVGVVGYGVRSFRGLLGGAVP